MGLQSPYLLFLIFPLLWLSICLFTFLISILTLTLSHSKLTKALLLWDRKSIRSNKRPRKHVNASQASSCKSEEPTNCFSLARKNSFFGLLLRCYDSTRRSSAQSWSTQPLAASTFAFSQTNYGSCDDPKAETQFDERGFNRIDRLVWALHESARSFSLAVESLKLSGSGPELAMAWVGKDVHGWHKQISYMVAIYALLKMAIEVEVMLSYERRFNSASPVKEILTPKIILIGEFIETQLNERHPELGEWFRVVELPRVAAFSNPLLKKWSVEYAGSGIAGMVVAISCCAAVEKLGSRRIAFSSCALPIKDVMVEFLDLAYSLVSVEKFHQLSNKAGFELDFLTHFGRKVVTSKNSEELEFWIGLAQKKLSIAFHKEIMISGGQAFSDKVQANTLATLGLFAYLGRRTRLFLSMTGIKDPDEPVSDFLSYVECGSIFIYPEFSYISSYQSFMEVVTDEIGWLDFYAPFPGACNQERRRSKQHTLQAEKEIVLSTAFTVCYDVFSGFAHFSRSTQQLLDTDLLKFLLQSQSLLASCLEDYWAVYGKTRTSEFLKITTSSVHDQALSSAEDRHRIKAVASEELQRNPSNVIVNEHPSEVHRQSSQWTVPASSPEVGTHSSSKELSADKSNLVHNSFIHKYTTKLVSASTDIWMGSQLLCMDIMMALELLYKQLRSYEITRRERFKLRRTLSDIGSLIPVTILMLLPVSAVGHAAMLAAIKKYMPSMIPSPYTSARLSVVKQLERTKKMEARLQNNFDDPSSKIS